MMSDSIFLASSNIDYLTSKWQVWFQQYTATFVTCLDLGIFATTLPLISKGYYSGCVVKEGDSYRNIANLILEECVCERKCWLEQHDLV